MRARTSLARGALAAAFALTVAAGTIAGIQAVREFGATAAASDSLDWADREIAWGNGWTLSQESLYAARSLIPSRADYDVLVGPTDRFDDVFTPTFVQDYLHYFLMPRHPREGARWVVCYRCDRPSGDVLWDDQDNGIAVIRRRPAQR